MPRRATGPRYYPSREAYYVQFHGKQHCLAVGPICAACADRERLRELPKCDACRKIRDKANLRFAELVHLSEAESAEDNITVFALVNRYLHFVEARRKEKTYEAALYILSPFSDECGHLRVKQLKPAHVEDWLDKMAEPRTVQTKRGPRARGWGPGTRRLAVDVVNACLSYGVRKLGVTRNPVERAVDRPRVVSRSKESLITGEEHGRLVERLEKRYLLPRYYPSKAAYFALVRNHPYQLAKGPEGDPATLAAAHARLAELRPALGLYEEFALVLRLLEHTGCRPGEIYNATAGDWRPDLGAFVYSAAREPEKEEGFPHQTARKGKERVVFVSDPGLRAAVAFLCSKHPTGPLLRNIDGKPWTEQAAWFRLDRLKKKLGLNPKITPYSYRHTSITNMLLAGHPWGLVAEVHGTSVAMLQRHYAHLDGHQKAMADFWAKAKAGPAAASAVQPEPPPAGGRPFRVVG